MINLSGNEKGTNLLATEQQHLDEKHFVNCKDELVLFMTLFLSLMFFPCSYSMSVMVPTCHYVILCKILHSTENVSLLCSLSSLHALFLTCSVALKGELGDIKGISACKGPRFRGSVGSWKLKKQKQKTAKFEV